MENQEVILLSAWFSPYALRVQWALKLKGIPFQIVEEDLRKKSHLLLKHNPVNQKIPVLLHQGKAIVDSLSIIEYIDETWNHSPLLMPQDPYDKAMARFWADFIEQKLHKAIRRAKVFKGEKKEREVKQAKEALKILDEMVKGKEFFGGDSVGFLDIALGWITLTLGVFEELACVTVFDSEKYTHLHKWMIKFVELQLIKETLPPKDKLLSVLQSYGHTSLAPLSTKSFNLIKLLIE
ncbi:probable glutathione S-transferase [Manihot esculenta]|uniref:glutathione transferase n=1 Tax=Manihot esculenta TaxID=3983 RepID=A0A2C9VGR0_MANES|nr:probable glutathione S-transferase [Manihot esculenta]OAY44550.1 hypothetical protein MANES_08G160100v8 [Manihot esculenta]